MTIKEMKETALNKVFEAYLDASRDTTAWHSRWRKPIRPSS